MKKVTVHELKNIIDGSKAACIVDIRSLAEYIHCNIKNALCLPLNYVDEFAAGLKGNKDIYIISNKGHRAKECCRKLDALEYRTFYVEGGMEAWRQNNFPVRISKQPQMFKHSVRLHFLSDSSLGHHVKRLIGTVYFFEKMNINVTLVFPENYNFFENPTLIFSKDDYSKNFIDTQFNMRQLNFCHKLHNQFCSIEYDHKVVSKLSINQHIQTQANKWLAQNLKNNWIGVHFRGTDMTKRIGNVKIDKYIAYLKTAIDERYDIFACSDQAQFIEQMHVAFPGRVFARNIYRSHNNQGIHCHYLVHVPPRWRLIYRLWYLFRYGGYKNFQQQQIENALIDLVILAKAKLIYKTGGYFSAMAKVLNPSIKIVGPRYWN